MPICLFDIIGTNKPIYTFENHKNIPLQDGTKKVIINAEAFENTEDKELKDFLEYLKTGKANNEFTREIEKMIQTVKQNEQARQEYRLLSTFEMDAMDKGAYNNKKQTAKLMKMEKCDNNFIMRITGLSEAEIENCNLII